MKNKEKYAECVLTFACDESGFGVYEKTGEMERFRTVAYRGLEEVGGSEKL